MSLTKVLKTLLLLNVFIEQKGSGRENKAVYTATLVACGWAGAVMK